MPQRAEQSHGTQPRPSQQGLEQHDHQQPLAEHQQPHDPSQSLIIDESGGLDLDSNPYCEVTHRLPDLAHSRQHGGGQHGSISLRLHVVTFNMGGETPTYPLPDQLFNWGTQDPDM